jgi:uncharacterized protein YndB with AHSA1/START domain
MDEHGLPTIGRSIWLPAPPDRLWSRLVDGAFLSTWFERPVRLDARVGGRIELDDGDGSVRWGTIEVLEPDHAIQWSWRTDDGDPSLVRIDLEPDEEGTRLVVNETLLAYEMTFHPRVGESSGRWLPRVPLP